MLWSAAEMEVFSPSAPGMNYLTITAATAGPSRNRYRNSIHYVDYLAGLTLRTIRETGGLSDTVVAVLGDHGEPIFEKGYAGHNQGYSAEEVRVPLVFHAPGLAPGSFGHQTSHLDLAPSVLKALGVRNPAADHSSGRDLADVSTRAFVSAASWDTAALIKPDGPAGVILTTLALSLLNPHVYLDTVLLLGSLAGQFSGHARLLFAMGAMGASLVWFYGIGYGARVLTPLFRRPASWRALDLLVGCTMWGLAANLLWSHVRGG